MDESEVKIWEVIWRDASTSQIYAYDETELRAFLDAQFILNEVHSIKEMS